MKYNYLKYLCTKTVSSVEVFLAHLSQSDKMSFCDTVLSVRVLTFSIK